MPTGFWAAMATPWVPNVAALLGPVHVAIGLALVAGYRRAGIRGLRLRAPRARGRTSDP